MYTVQQQVEAIQSMVKLFPLTMRRRTDQCYDCANYACPVDGMPDVECPYIMQERMAA
jgi:hypothetical protein